MECVFRDVEGPASADDAEEAKFADDLNVYKAYPASWTVDRITQELRK